MKIIKVSDLFEIQYGANLELNRMELDSKGINFVSRTSKNNGVVAKVKKIQGVQPNPAYTLSVASGGSVLETFFQETEYYSGRDLYYLKPKIQLSIKQFFAYATIIKANKYKYNYGRQANRTLKDLLIPAPSEIPEWVYNLEVKTPSKLPLNKTSINLQDRPWQLFKYEDIFKLSRGKEKIQDNSLGSIPLISSTGNNNGISSLIADGNNLFSKNTITVANNGSVGATFYQDKDFFATTDVTILENNNLNQYNSQFLTTIISMEKYRFNYGLKWGLERMRNTKIGIPIDSNNNPDWQFMEDYIKSLPYSKNLS